MTEFSTEVWLVLGLLGGALLLAILHTFAVGMGHAIARHDLYVRVELLRREYLERIAEGGGTALPGGVIEVGPAEDLEDLGDVELVAA